MKHIVTLLYSVQCECVCFSESDFDSCFYFYCFFFFILWTVPRICACVCVSATGLNDVNFFLLCKQWMVHLYWSQFTIVCVLYVMLAAVEPCISMLTVRWCLCFSIQFSTLLHKFCFTFRLSVRHYFGG